MEGAVFGNHIGKNLQKLDVNSILSFVVDAAKFDKKWCEIRPTTVQDIKLRFFNRQHPFCA